MYIALPPQPKRTAAVAFDADNFGMKLARSTAQVCLMCAVTELQLCAGDLPEVDLEHVAMVEAAHASAVHAAADPLPPTHIEVAILAVTLSMSSQPRVANPNAGSSL